MLVCSEFGIRPCQEHQVDGGAACKFDSSLVQATGRHPAESYSCDLGVLSNGGFTWSYFKCRCMELRKSSQGTKPNLSICLWELWEALQSHLPGLCGSHIKHAKGLAKSAKSHNKEENHVDHYSSLAVADGWCLQHHTTEKAGASERMFMTSSLNISNPFCLSSCVFQDPACQDGSVQQHQAGQTLQGQAWVVKSGHST